MHSFCKPRFLLKGQPRDLAYIIIEKKKKKIRLHLQTNFRKYADGCEGFFEREYHSLNRWKTEWKSINWTENKTKQNKHESKVRNKCWNRTTSS